MSSDQPPRTPDTERTDPGIRSAELDAVIRVARDAAEIQELRRLTDVVEALRVAVAPVTAAATRREQARALICEALADGLRSPIPVVGLRVGSVSLLGLAGALGLGLLSALGIAVDLGALADAAAHAWSGEPHRVECEVPASGPIGPAPGMEDTPR